MQKPRITLFIPTIISKNLDVALKNRQNFQEGHSPPDFCSKVFCSKVFGSKDYCQIFDRFIGGSGSSPD